MQALWIAKTGLDAQQTQMSMISNNLANVNTNGFKRDRAVFEDLLYQTVAQSGAATSQDTTNPTGLNIGTGVRIVGSEKNFSQGSVVSTNNPLDVMIDGRGFFRILLPDGSSGYTRNGSFKVDPNGQLVTAGGYQVQPAITIPTGVQSITISKDGIVQAKLANQPDPTTVGSLQLADFLNPAGLQPRGENLFLETRASGSPQTGTPSLNGLGGVQQGALEGSNVNVVEELVAMIQTQRAYEMNSKAISTGDQMLQYLNNNL